MLQGCENQKGSELGIKKGPVLTEDVRCWGIGPWEHSGHPDMKGQSPDVMSMW